MMYGIKSGIGRAVSMVDCPEAELLFKRHIAGLRANHNAPVIADPVKRDIYIVETLNDGITEILNNVVVRNAELARSCRDKVISKHLMDLNAMVRRDVLRLVADAENTRTNDARTV